MLNATTRNTHAFEYARWYPTQGDRINYKNLKVELISNKEVRYSHIIKNLVSPTESTALKTDYGYAYKVNDEIYYNGQWWLLLSINDLRTDLNSQAMRLTGSKVNSQWLLELIGVSKNG